MEGEIGSISRGKKADLCAVRLDGLHVTPTADDNPVAALVYGCHASDVVMTMVGGRVLYEGGWHILLDVSRLRHCVTETRKRLRREVAKSLGAG
jgi:5-methylthioadenosine/S-adenosylhomocysteine deaminase